MPDEQRREDASAEERLGARFEEIEREEASRAEKEDLPPFPDLERLPEPPSNDEIRARLYTSPIESPLNPDDLGPEEAVSSDEKRLNEISASLEPKDRTDSGHDQEFDRRLRSFQDKVADLRTSEEARRKAQESRQAADRASARGLGLGLSAAYTIIGIPLIGVAIGWLVDREFGTTAGKAIGVLVGGALGITLALMILSRAKQEN